MLSDASFERATARGARTRQLGAAMYVLIAGTAIHHVLAFSQAPADKTRPQDIVPAAAINLAFFAFLLWIAREARQGRRTTLATISTLGFSVMMVGGFAFAHVVLGFTGATWLIAAQVVLALIAIVATTIAVRACAT